MSERWKCFVLTVSDVGHDPLGIFDTILIKTKCPKCRREDDDLQTKALDPKGHTYCKRCNTGSSYKVLVKDNKIIGQVEPLGAW